MTKKSAANVKTSTPVKADWKGFADVPLTSDDKAAIRLNPYSESELWEALTNLLSTGHKIAASFAPETGNITVAITGAYSHCPNKGLTLTSTGKDIVTALNVALYKHFDKASGVWSNVVQDDDGIS